MCSSDLLGRRGGPQMQPANRSLGGERWPAWIGGENQMQRHRIGRARLAPNGGVTDNGWGRGFCVNGDKRRRLVCDARHAAGNVRRRMILCTAPCVILAVGQAKAGRKRCRPTVNARG